MDFGVSAASVRRLLEIGYIAAGNGLFADAELIFRGVAAVRPESVAPAIGRAVAALNRGDAAEAVRRLEAERERSPDDPLLQAFLGLALRSAGRNAESVALLTTLIENPNSVAAAMAKAILVPNTGA
jgi:Flp pilus assembly protein TadD